MCCFLIVGVLNLLQYIWEKGWETHDPPYLMIVFWSLYIALVLFFLLQAVVGIIRDEKLEKSYRPEGPAGPKVFHDEEWDKPDKTGGKSK